MNTLRCTICNKTNNPEVVSNPGEYIKGTGTRFFPDPKYKHSFVCAPCKEEIDSVLHEYYLDDLYKSLDEEK